MSATFPLARGSTSADSIVLRRRLVAASGLGAAALVGFGLILWIAANWSLLGRFGQFALVGCVGAVSAALAAVLRPARVAGLLCALLATGGLLALFGQSYQTGADPWTLFLYWAVLCLPFAIAARHDVVWSAWTIVAFTALPLWVVAMTGAWDRASNFNVLPAWIVGAAITFALSPISRLQHWIGTTRWSYRLAVVLLLALIVGQSLVDLFARQPMLFGLGLLLVGGLIAALLFQHPRDLPLLAAAALAMDVLLIGGFYRMLFAGHFGNLSSFLFAGLVSAGIVGASAVALLRAAEAAPLAAEASGQAAAAETPQSAQPSRWPVALLAGVGALLAALPLWLFYGTMFGWFMRSAIGAIALGAMTVAGALAMLRKADDLGFRQQFGFIALVTGLGVVAFGCFTGLPGWLASLLMALICAGLVMVVAIGWVRGLLGAAIAVFVTVALVAPTVLTKNLGAVPLSWILSVPTMIAISGAAGLLLMPPRSEADTLAGAAFGPALSGWCVAAVIMQIYLSGQTFLLGASSLPGLGAGSGGGVTAVLITGRVLSVGCALVAAALLLVHRPALRSLLGYALCAAAVVLAAMISRFGPCLLIAAAAVLTGRRALAVLAAFGALWVLGSLYYMLHMTLAQKALALTATGITLGGIAIIEGFALPTFARTATEQPASGWSRTIATALIALGITATASTVGYGIVEKEHIIANGQRLYIRLAPVDPRSLMQGDYMTLRFDLPDRGIVNQGRGAEGALRRQAVATLDGKGIAKIDRIVEAPAKLAAGEIAIDLTFKNRAFIVASDAWFFKEGEGKRFEEARFGEFRVLGNGKVLLVGMADEQLRPIR